MTWRNGLLVRVSYSNGYRCDHVLYSSLIVCFNHFQLSLKRMKLRKKDCSQKVSRRGLSAISTCFFEPLSHMDVIILTKLHQARHDKGKGRSAAIPRGVLEESI